MMRGRADRGERRARIVPGLAFLLAACWPLHGFAQPAAGGNQPASVSAYVPVVGSTLGANDIRWKTQLELDNSGPTEAIVGISLPAAPDQPLLILTIPPSSLHRFDAVVGEDFRRRRARSTLLLRTQAR